MLPSKHQRLRQNASSCLGEVMEQTHGFLQKGTLAFQRTNQALFLGGFASFSLLYVVQPLLPLFSQDFGITATQSSLALSVSTLTLALGMLVTGPLSDALGRKPMMLVALWSATLFSLLAPLMPTWEGLLLMRALSGLALSGLVAVAMSYLGEEMEPSHLGLAMGLYISGNSLGGMSGRLLSGFVVEVSSWMWALAIQALLAGLATLLFWCWLPSSKHFHARPWSIANVLGGLRLHLRDAGLPWLFAEAFLLMGSFVALFNYIGYRLLEPPYDWSPVWVGLLSLAYLSGTYSATKAGAMADRWGRQRVFWPSILIMLLGLGLTLSSRLWAILLGLLLYSYGFFAGHSLASSWVSSRAHQARGQASALYLFSYYLGSSVAGTLAGLFWQAGHWKGVVVFIAVLLIAALLIALRLSTLPQPQPNR